MVLWTSKYKSYYLTITKILQDQLVDDFGDNIVELKGRNAYPCTFYDRYGESMVDKKLWTRNQLTKYKAISPDCGNGFCKSKFNTPIGDAPNVCVRAVLKKSLLIFKYFTVITAPARLASTRTPIVLFHWL